MTRFARTERTLLTAALLFCSAALIAADKPTDKAASGKAEAEPPRIEVCFVLDTTGSMSGLIEGAKRKVWAIANGIVATDPTPRVRVGLIGYRDRGDEYVTRRFDLDGNIDAVYENLQKFKADGGGDTPESVNQALHEAIEKMSWTDDRDVSKIIFLVGDAPPHMDYENELKHPELCRMAVKRNLIINTVQCGSISATRPVWQQIARRAEGEFVALEQDGNMRVTSTPYDEQLAMLNRRIGETMVPYGDGAARRKMGARQRASETAEAQVAADRAGYFALKAAPSRSEVNTGTDLTAALAAEKIDINNVKPDKLPEKLQEMGDKERRAHLEKQVAERRELKEKIKNLSAKRRDYITQERERAAAYDEDSFDEQVMRIVREQAALSAK